VTWTRTACVARSSPPRVAVHAWPAAGCGPASRCWCFGLGHRPGTLAAAVPTSQTHPHKHLHACAGSCRRPGGLADPAATWQTPSAPRSSPGGRRDCPWQARDDWRRRAASSSSRPSRRPACCPGGGCRRPPGLGRQPVLRDGAAASGAFPEKEIDVIGSSFATAEDFRRAIRLVAAIARPSPTCSRTIFRWPARPRHSEFAMSSADPSKEVVTVN